MVRRAARKQCQSWVAYRVRSNDQRTSPRNRKLATHWYMRHRQLHAEVQRVPALATGAIWGVMLILIAITQGGGNAFIYFQF